MIDKPVELKRAAITFLVEKNYTTIELHDRTSNLTFASVTLTPEQLSMALSRLGYTPCKIIVAGVEKLNKQMLVEELQFEIPDELSPSNQVLVELADAHCPKGWISDNYFNSQNSLFYKGNKRYARVTIRKWVDESLPDTP